MSTHPGTPDTDTPPSVQAAPTDTGPDHREPDREFRHIEALAACAARGDRDCLGELYELTVDQVFRFLHMRTCNVHLAEDLTSDTWLHAAKAISTYRWRRGKGFTAWLFTIARNKLRDHYRSPIASRVDYRPPASMVTLTNSGTPVGCPALRKAVADAIGLLPKKQRAAVVCHDVIGMTHVEAATVLGTAPAAVRKNYQRGIATLRTVLGQPEEDHVT